MPLTIFEAMMVAISLSTLIVSVLALSFTFTQKSKPSLPRQHVRWFTFITLQIAFEAIRLVTRTIGVPAPMVLFTYIHLH